MEPALVRHVLLVRDPAAAEALAAAVTADGYDVRIDTVDGGLTWIVRATDTAEHADTAREGLAALAARHGAEYEGWEAGRP